MEKQIRFGDYIGEITVQQKPMKYAELIAQDQTIDTAYPLSKLQLRNIDIYRLIKPYLSARFYAQLKVVLPLAAYLVLFQLFILRQYIADWVMIMAGLAAVIIGLMMFMEGLKVGLMPFGQKIGKTLPTRSPLPIVLSIAFLLGIGVTFAEPAIGALKTVGSIVDAQKTPYLYALLNEWSEILVLVVGIGVGLAAILGTLRFVYSFSLKPLIYLSMVPCLGLTTYIMLNPQLSSILGLAWDCGAVTTGPVTVPLILSLGIGIASSVGKGESSLSGFGIVTLASLFPIIGVMLLAIYVYSTIPAEEIIANALQAAEVTREIAWYESTPLLEIISGIRAIVPLVLFLLAIMYFILRQKITGSDRTATFYGILLCVLGMIIFNMGLSYGLAKLGSQSGGLVPASFTQIELVKESPLYSFSLGIVIAALFAWCLGFGATMAEPALNALGLTVENLTNGAFKKSMLMYAVSIGVGCGITIGIMKIIFSIPIAYLLLPFYSIAILLTIFSTEEFVNIAWDSAGVTTGPVTVPLVLAMGLSFGQAVESLEGFGILSMASICPIISVLATGLWVRLKISTRHKKNQVND